MICDKCEQEIDNLKGGYIVTKKNGVTKYYHDRYIETITDENGVETQVEHESCYNPATD